VKQPRSLFFLFLSRYGFEVLSFENLTAIQALQVFHPVAPGDDLCTAVFTNLLHKARLRIYSNEPESLVKGLFAYFLES
jgi:hypothetical protein